MKIVIYHVMEHIQKIAIKQIDFQIVQIVNLLEIVWIVKIVLIASFVLI